MGGLCLAYLLCSSTVCSGTEWLVVNTLLSNGAGSGASDLERLTTKGTQPPEVGCRDVWVFQPVSDGRKEGDTGGSRCHV